MDLAGDAACSPSFDFLCSRCVVVPAIEDRDQALMMSVSEKPTGRGDPALGRFAVHSRNRQILRASVLCILQTRRMSGIRLDPAAL